MAAYRLPCGGYGFHSSRLGGCIHGQVRALLGHPATAPPPDADLLQLFAEGHESEERVKQSILGVGINLTNASSDLVHQLHMHLRWWDKRLHCNMEVSCHPDGTLELRNAPSTPLHWMAAGYETINEEIHYRFPTLERDFYGFEHKFLKTAKRKTINVYGLEEFVQYRWQLAAQSACLTQHFGLSEPAWLAFSVEHNLDRGLRSRHLYTFPPPFTVPQIQARCREIVLAARLRQIPECTAPSANWCEYPT